MGRFLAIVLALVAIALVINWYQSKNKPADTKGPALVTPDKGNEEATPVPLIKDVPEPSTTSPAEISKQPSTEEVAPSPEVEENAEPQESTTER